MLRRLYPSGSVPGWALVILGAWNLLANLNTAIEAPKVISELWEFITTPSGNAIILVVGLVWIFVTTTKPKWLATALGQFKRQDPLAPIVEKLYKIENSLKTSDDHIARLAAFTGGIDDQVKGLDENLKAVESATFLRDKASALGNILVHYKRTTWHLGEIAPTARFEFEIYNAGKWPIKLTGKTSGAPLV